LKRIQQALAACADQGTPFDLELEIVTAKGNLIGVRSIGEAERNADGVITRLQGAFQDITERKRIAEKLQVSEQRFRALFDQAAVGVAQADALTGKYLQVNQRYCQITGRTADELADLTAVAITHPDYILRDRELVGQVIAGVIREFTVEKRYIRKDASEVWVQVTVSAMWEPNAQPDYFIAVAQDITERKKMEEQFYRAQKLDAIGTLAGGIAHDFNNALAAINGYTELARMRLKENPEVHDFLGSVLKASKRAAALVRQILTFSRREMPERRHISLLPVVEESFKLLRATIPTTVEFDIVLAPDTPPVLADATQVHQILMNLGTNAWHAMKDRPGRLQVALETKVVDEAFGTTQVRLPPGTYARLSITDNGCGMEPAIMRRIFEPFFTTKPVGQGTGLGLAVVHGIMANHDGAVTVYSHPGEGTVFHLYFPAHLGEMPIAIKEEASTPIGQGERVLFVDDEELLGQLGKRTLSVLGYEVEVAQDPVAALELVRADPARFDLVVTDQTMPGMTGLTLAQEILRLRPGLPIILMTGYGLALKPEQIETAGIRQLLIKPTTLHLLGVAVRAALSPQISH
jgi:PAS domain S-box-containing protein